MIFKSPIICFVSSFNNKTDENVKFKQYRSSVIPFKIPSVQNRIENCRFCDLQLEFNIVAN
jgi:hypothetical protein